MQYKTLTTRGRTETPKTMGLNKEPQGQGDGTHNPNNKGIEFKTLRKEMKLRIPRRRGRKSESRQKWNGTWDQEKKAIEFKTQKMTGRNLDALEQGEETQNVEN